MDSTGDIGLHPPIDTSEELDANLTAMLNNLSETNLHKLESALVELAELQVFYRDFKDFYYDCSTELLGFTPSKMQMDMAQEMQDAPQYFMIQAQRGEAKTTIAGCFAVWLLIHHPEYRILIISAGGDLASDIMTWCTQILMMMPILAVLYDDPTGTCRRSAEKFDVNLLLKGANKTASISCYGITSSLAGKRADFLLADDVESQKNSMTELMRERLNHLTLDFSSINAKGSICYLGTPQSSNSIYNNLPSRGYTIRIYPGRIPTIEEREHYGEHLAPYIRVMYDNNPHLRTGYGAMLDRGAPTDPIMMPEHELVKKEIDQGPSYFNLQYMLDTTLLDKDRFPLKVADLIFHDLDPFKVPSIFQWSNHPMHQLGDIPGQLAKQKYYRAGLVGDDYVKYVSKIVAFDPAGGGQNGDETGYAVIFSAAGKLFLMECGGIPGGNGTDAMEAAVAILRKWDVQKAVVEKNFGHGAYAVTLESTIMTENFKLIGLPDKERLEKTVNCGVVEVYNTGQKELRIADGLEPIIANHKLVVNTSVITENISSTQKYEAAKRVMYNLFHQMHNLTRDRGSLMHEDRLEAVQIGISELMLEIRMVDEEETRKIKDAELEAIRNDPNSVWRHAHGGIHGNYTGGIGNVNNGIMNRINSNKRITIGGFKPPTKL